MLQVQFQSFIRQVYSKSFIYNMKTAIVKSEETYGVVHVEYVPLPGFNGTILYSFLYPDLEFLFLCPLYHLREKGHQGDSQKQIQPHICKYKNKETVKVSKTFQLLRLHNVVVGVQNRQTQKDRQTETDSQLKAVTYQKHLKMSTYCRVLRSERILQTFRSNRSIILRSCQSNKREELQTNKIRTLMCEHHPHSSTNLIYFLNTVSRQSVILMNNKHPISVGLIRSKVKRQR